MVAATFRLRYKISTTIHRGDGVVFISVAQFLQDWEEFKQKSIAQSFRTGEKVSFRNLIETSPKNLLTFPIRTLQYNISANR